MLCSPVRPRYFDPKNPVMDPIFEPREIIPGDDHRPSPLLKNDEQLLGKTNIPASMSQEASHQLVHPQYPVDDEDSSSRRLPFQEPDAPIPNSTNRISSWSSSTNQIPLSRLGPIDMCVLSLPSSNATVANSFLGEDIQLDVLRVPPSVTMQTTPVVFAEYCDSSKGNQIRCCTGSRDHFVQMLVLSCEVTCIMLPDEDQEYTPKSVGVGLETLI